MKDRQMASKKRSAPPRKSTKHIPLFDTVYLVLGLVLCKRGIKTLPRKSVYVGFCALKKKYPEHFENLGFTWRGGIPHSKAIEDTLFRMGGVLSSDASGKLLT